MIIKDLMRDLPKDKMSELMLNFNQEQESYVEWNGFVLGVHFNSQNHPELVVLDVQGAWTLARHK